MVETQREPADLRLLDVLLEEELGAARRAAAPPQRGRWLAAAMLLLGAGAVLGVWLGRSHEPAAVPAASQDPQRAEVQVKDLDELRRHLLLDVRRIDVEGAFTLRTPEELAPWLRGLEQCELSDIIRDKRDQTLAMRLELGDGRRIPLQVTPPVIIVGAMMLDIAEALRPHLDVAAKVVRGEVVDEFASLPAGTRRLNGFFRDAQTVRRWLPRFKELEHLECSTTGSTVVVTGDMVTAISGLPTVRSLKLPADGLGNRELSMLARMQLRELHLTGQLGKVSDVGFSGLQTLERLVLDLSGCEGDLPAIFAALPRLQRLELRGWWFGLQTWPPPDRRHLSAALLACKAPTLSLGGGPGSSALSIGPDDLSLLGSLQHLRRLELSRVIWFRPEGHHGEVDLAALSLLLPACEVVEETVDGGSRTFWCYRKR